jgi:hypothetical protein
MAKKKITFEALAVSLAKMDGKIDRLDARMERAFVAASAKSATDRVHTR